MSPKEKAKQLIDSYSPTVMNLYMAKACAIIGVKETLKVINSKPTKDYMEQVEAEIKSY